MTSKQESAMARDVVRYLPKGYQAYEQPTYAAARLALLELRRELRLVNRPAAASLEEGLEETLTLHRRGVFGVLGRSLKTTNCLESLNAQVG